MGEQNSSALPFHFLGLTCYLTGQMQAITRKRLLRVAHEGETLANVRSIATELLMHNKQMDRALQRGNLETMAKALHGSKKTIEKLRFVLGLERQA